MEVNQWEFRRLILERDVEQAERDGGEIGNGGRTAGGGRVTGVDDRAKAC